MATSNTKVTISLVIPIFNRSQSIERVVTEIPNGFSAGLIEIILLNDESKDNLAQVCKSLAHSFSYFAQMSDLARNFTEQDAVLAGLGATFLTCR